MNEYEKRIVAFLGVLCEDGTYTWKQLSEAIKSAKDYASDPKTALACYFGDLHYDAAQKLTTELLDGIRV